jgi:hypothetical protein
MYPRAPAYIVQSIKSDYFGYILPKNIITRHPEVARTIVYLICKNLKEHGAAYPILHAELPPIGRRQLITPTMEDDIVKLLIRASTHYLNEIRHWILINYNI